MDEFFVKLVLATGSFQFRAFQSDTVGSFKARVAEYCSLKLNKFKLSHNSMEIERYGPERNLSFHQIRKGALVYIGRVFDNKKKEEKVIYDINGG